MEATAGQRMQEPMKTTNRRLLTLALTALFSHVTYCFGMSYCVKGSFTYEAFAIQKGGEPPPGKTFHREFEVLSDGYTWKVKIVLVGNTNYDSFIYSYDGTNLLDYSILAPGLSNPGVMDTVTVQETAV